MEVGVRADWGAPVEKDETLVMALGPVVVVEELLAVWEAAFLRPLRPELQGSWVAVVVVEVVGTRVALGRRVEAAATVVYTSRYSAS